MNPDFAIENFTVEDLWAQIVGYIPELLVALLIIVVGWIIASVLGSVACRVVHFTGVDRMIDNAGLNDRLNITNRSNYRLLSGFVGTVVKWLIIILALAMASDVLGLTQVSEFLSQIIAYIPRVIVAVIILTVGVLLSRFVGEIILAGFTAIKLPPTTERLIATVARYAIVVFAVMAALTQLGIVPRLIEIAFAGMVFALALAFGLGGKDHANEWLRSLRQQS